MATERVVLRAVDIESARHGSVRLTPMRFTVERGELVALFGPSGAGKSLLLALIAGEVALEGGRLEVADFATMPDLPDGRALRTATRLPTSSNATRPRSPARSICWRCWGWAN
jgi:ABC-type transport system involved in cytochrome bd biosynthesis fused ATPase/permease subunit